LGVCQRLWKRYEGIREKSKRQGKIEKYAEEGIRTPVYRYYLD